MRSLGLLFLLTGQVEILPSADFSREVQLSAIRATVRVVNVPEGTGTGVVLGKKGEYVYILTAHHLVKKADRLEVSTFAVDTYPKPKKTYRSAEMVLDSDDLLDLALIRVRTDDDVPGSLQLCPEDLVPQQGSFNGLAAGYADVGARPA